MEIHPDTKALLDRMCRNVERRDFVLEKEKAVECLMKTYDLFGLKRPKKVQWCVDIFDGRFSDAAWSASSASLAWSASSASSAWSASSASSMRAARLARLARSASSASSTRAAWSASSTRAARSASSALDYDFDWYVFEYEYRKNPDKSYPPNGNDKLYLEYCEFLLQAKEHGMGYRIEWEDTLYCVPVPLVSLDQHNNFHSETSPAIQWKEGAEFYFLRGVKLEEKLWKKIVTKTLSAKECIAVVNMEQRMIALKYLGVDKLLENANALHIATSERNNALYVIPKESGTFPQDEFFLKYKCPSTGRIYVKCIDPEIGRKHDPDLAQASTFQYPDWTEKGLEWKNCTKEQYLALTCEA